MKHRTRVAGAALLVAVIAVAGSATSFAATADAKKKPKGPTVNAEDACTMLWSKRIENAFGGPVAILPDTTIAGTAGCAAAVGTDPAVPPGGTLQAFTEYPNLLGSNPSARAAVEDRRAGDALSDDVLTDVEKVGKSAYFNRTKGTITVLASKKLAFTLQWARAGDVAISDADQAALVSLAKNVVARFTR